jgi:hypothetical protein
MTSDQWPMANDQWPMTSDQWWEISGLRANDEGAKIRWGTFLNEAGYSGLPLVNGHSVIGHSFSRIATKG